MTVLSAADVWVAPSDRDDASPLSAAPIKKTVSDRPPPSHDIIIVGGGIIGLSCALYLREAGHSVLLLERGEWANEASRGNAGALAFAEILPLASPRILRKAFGWLRDPLGPLALPPAYAARIAPWLLRLWRASWPRHYAANIKAQAALMGLAQAEMFDMIARFKLQEHLHSEGVLELYESEASFVAARETADWRRRYGIASHAITGEALAELQPGLAPQFTHGMFIPAWRNVGDPHAFALAIGQAARAAGVQFQTQAARALRTSTAGASVILADGHALNARRVVVAAGAWSHQLSKTLDEPIPLETERGYNTTLPIDAFPLARQLTFSDHGFVVSPLRCGVRIGGAVELGGLQRPPDYRRAQAMLDKARQFLPGLRTEGGAQWMGFRPSLPDSLPIISRSSRTPDIVYAFGHGHLGLTQSAATARLVTDLVLNRSPAIALSPYRATRFRLFGPLK